MINVFERNNLCIRDTKHMQPCSSDTQLYNKAQLQRNVSYTAKSSFDQVNLP